MGTHNQTASGADTQETDRQFLPLPAPPSPTTATATKMLGYVARQYRWYKLEFGLTMLSWWEVAIFSTSPTPSLASLLSSWPVTVDVTLTLLRCSPRAQTASCSSCSASRATTCTTSARPSRGSSRASETPGDFRGGGRSSQGSRADGHPRRGRPSGRVYNFNDLFAPHVGFPGHWTPPREVTLQTMQRDLTGDLFIRLSIGDWRSSSLILERTFMGSAAGGAWRRCRSDW